MRRAVIAITIVAAVTALAAQQPEGSQRPGRSDPSFQQPSIGPGVDYTLPSEAEIRAPLDRIRQYFVRSTPFRVIDAQTRQPVGDLSRPTRTAAIDTGDGEFGEWTYSNGATLAGMLLAADVTGDKAFEAYVERHFQFLLDHLEYFREQARLFGPETGGFRRLLNMRELDDCGAIGAALVKMYRRNKDPRYRPIIDAVADFISHRMSRMANGTLARPRPHPVSVWVDDMYMSIPFLAQMGLLTGEERYYDDAARQVIQYSELLMNRQTGLLDHSWFAHEPDSPHFYWGRGNGWALMAMAELLSVLPETHPRRAEVLALYRRAAQGAAAVQSGTGFWHQLLDRTDSYLETSATAMNTFAIARGVNRGWLQPVYAPVAQAGWRAVEQRIAPDGTVGGTCVGTTAAYDAVYYYNRPTDPKAAQGFGAALMAGSEVLTMLRNFDVQKRLNTFHYFPKK